MSNHLEKERNILPWKQMLIFYKIKFQIKYIYPFVTINHRKFEISLNEEITFYTTKHLLDRGRRIDTHLSTIRKNEH